MGEWTRRVMLRQGNIPAVTSGWDLRAWKTRPLLALVAFYQQALYVYISPCGAQHRALRPGRAAAGRGPDVIPRGRSCSPWPQRS